MTPHFGKPTLPPFQQSCGKLIIQHNAIIGKQLDTKRIYDNILPQNITDIQDNARIPLKYLKIAAQNLHEYNLDNTCKQITFKLIYSALTPLKNTRCALCTHHVENEERHILLKCKETQPTVTHYISHIQQTTPYAIHTEMALKHNIIPFTNKQTHEINLHLLAITRRSIWTARNKTKYDGHKTNHLGIRQIAINLARIKLNKDTEEGRTAIWEKHQQLVEEMRADPPG